MTQGQDTDRILKLVGFRIEDWRFAVRLAQVQTSIMPCPVTRLWHVPAFVAGVISLRGTIVCVLDLGRLLCLAGTGGAPSRLLVVRDSGVQAAIPVHDVFRVPDIPQDLVEPLPQGMDPSHREIVEGIINTSRLPGASAETQEGERTITLIDVSTLFSCGPVRTLRGHR